MQKTKDPIKQWLSNEFNIPIQNWKSIKNSTNLYSSTRLYSQNHTTHIPNKIFVKSIHSNKPEDDKKHYLAEKEAITLAGDIKTGSNVKSPKVYAFNDSLSSVAMEFVDGCSLFNTLWNWRRNRLFIYSIPPAHLEILKDVTQWLEAFHKSLKFYNVNKKTILKNTFNGDLIEIEKRIEIIKTKPHYLVDMNVIGRAYQLAIEITKKHNYNTINYVLCHSDFTLANMIFSEKGIHIIDYSMTAISSREEDLARLIADICNINLSCLYAKRINSLEEFKAIDLILQSYQYNLHKNKNILSFFLIKHILINITMYVSHLNNISNNNMLHYVFLLNQMNLLKTVLLG